MKNKSLKSNFNEILFTTGVIFKAHGNLVKLSSTFKI